MSATSTSLGSALDRAPKEVAHQARDLLAVLFQREVAGVEQVQPGLGQVAQIGGGAFRRKDLVVLAPDDEHRRLVLAEIRLTRRA